MAACRFMLRGGKTPWPFAQPPAKTSGQLRIHQKSCGETLHPFDVRKPVKLSAGKYCPTSTMLGKVAEITHDFDAIKG